MFCQNCGAPDDGGVRCRDCGSKDFGPVRPEITPEQRAERVPTPPTPPPTSNAGEWGCAFVIVIIGFALFYYFFS